MSNTIAETGVWSCLKFILGIGSLSRGHSWIALGEAPYLLEIDPFLTPAMENRQLSFGFALKSQGHSMYLMVFLNLLLVSVLEDNQQYSVVYGTRSMNLS